MRTAATHLITGGTGGLGLLTARWLGQHGARDLVLCSRSGTMARDVVIEQEQLQASSAAVIVERCDTSEDAHVRRLMALGHRLSPVAGVWHAAGVLADGVLPGQSAMTLARVCAPKAQGASALHLGGALQAQSTSVLFSSVAALLGGAGQSNYSAANAWLDALSVLEGTHGRGSVCVQRSLIHI